MPWLQKISSAFRSLFRKKQLDRELDEEVSLYLEMLTEEKIKAGIPPAEARRRARLELGGEDQVKEKVREVRVGVWLDTLWQDLSFGARQLRRNPGFTAVAGLTLALGIGANTAIFSVVNAVLLRPLPFQEPERLVRMWNRDIRDVSANRPYGLSPANFLDLASESRSFEGLTGMRWRRVNLTGTPQPERIVDTRVTANFFNLIGVRATLGRTFLPEEGKPGAEPVVVLGNGFWKSHFGADPDVLGNTIKLNERPHTIIGVMPAGFRMLDHRTKLSPNTELWTTLRPSYTDPKMPNYFTLARLKPGVRIKQAEAEVKSLVDWNRAYPKEWETRQNWQPVIEPLEETIAGKVRPRLIFLLVAAGFVMLIACANVANLLLGRSSLRQKELAVRSALGAGRSRLIRQMLTESLLLSILGTALGSLLAMWGVRLIIALSPGGIPRLGEASIDGAVLGFLLGVSVLTAILFGLAPALRGSRTDLNESLKDGVRGLTGGTGGQHMQRVLVASEIALALTLLAGAGLMINTLVRLINVDPGFDPQNLLTMDLYLPTTKFTDRLDVADDTGHLRKIRPQADNFRNEVLERIKRLPGVESAAVTICPPFNSGFFWGARIRTEDSTAETSLDVAHYPVSSDYFRTLQLPLLRGRRFNEADSFSSPWVVVIDETLARQHFPNENPVGKRLWVEESDTLKDITYRPREIVGVVGAVRQGKLENKPEPSIYVPYAQRSKAFPSYYSARWQRLIFIARISSEPKSLAEAMRQAVWESDKNQTIDQLAMMDYFIDLRSISQRRFYMLLLAVFAGLALLLAAIGIFGVISFTVSRRTHEIGVRMTLGAQPRDILKLILKQGLAPVLVGIVIGLGGAYGATRVLSSFLYGVTATDPATFIGVSVLLTVVALLACYIPARRATKVDPMVALRYE